MALRVHVLQSDVAMHKVSLLYIEDDSKAQEHYSKGFSALFSNIYLATDARSGFELYKKEKPDILLVDIELPEESGLSLIERIRKEDKETIIIILSAFSQQQQLLKAIPLGLYRYLVKPVRNTELLSILNEAIRLAKMNNQALPIVLCNDLYWSSENLLLSEGNREIPLSKHENSLITLLYKNKDKILSIQDITYNIWNYQDEPSEQAIKNLIHRLRKKVSVDFIYNHYGVGYQLTP